MYHKWTWKYLFEHQILERGEHYYQEGQVGVLRQNGNEISAIVMGSQPYRVEIDWPYDYPEDMRCNCPYTKKGERCKHMAAVLYAIEDEKIILTKPPVAPEPMERGEAPLPWQTALEALPEAVLRRELGHIAAVQSELQEKLVICSRGALPKELLRKWRAALWETAETYTDRTGAVPVDQAEEYLYEQQNFLVHYGDMLIEAGAAADVLPLAWYVFETVLWVPVDAAPEDWDDFWGGCKAVLEQAFCTATEAQKQTMAEWFWTHRNSIARRDGTEMLQPESCVLTLSWSPPLREYHAAQIDTACFAGTLGAEQASRLRASLLQEYCYEWE